MIKANNNIAVMAPYASATFEVAKGKSLVSLAQNESFLPSSKRALTAGQRAAKEMVLYPDSSYQQLRSSIAKVHGLDAEKVLVSAGSMELIFALGQAYLSPSRSALSTQYSYAFFRTATALAQAEFVTVPEPDLTVSVEHLLLAVSDNTSIVFVANPANPCGTHIPKSDLVRLRAELRDDILLVIDEAYGEFADAIDEPTFDLVSGGNTVVLRTFSKAYGLAGARVGWGYFPTDVKAELQKIINPGSVATVSQAMATAAMEDQQSMERLCQETTEIRSWFTAEARALGLEVPTSLTNFVLVCFADAQTAADADKALRQEAIVLRGMAGYGLPQALRATIGTKDQMAFVIDTLRKFLGA